MATITSTQSGNFSAGSTWVGGVAPVDGDSFVIATGHTVTYDVASPVTNGFDDSNIYGILQTQLNTSTVLRMNGRLQIRTNGTYHARAGHTLQFRGVTSASHILYAVGETGASVIIEGSDGMPTTTLSAGANEGSTSFSFTSATNFAVGEWFAVFDNTTAQTGNAGASTLRDEGFWVHDISGNTVYFRQFVGPETTVVSASGTSLVVANSKVFRVGQKIIFGTGANRNIHTINGINYDNHILTLSGSVTGTVTGLTVYETGTDKIHISGEKVRKVATVTTASSTSTSTTITVSNANMFAANDDIWIEARSECGGSGDYGYNAYGNETPGPRYKHTISSVNGNTITLTGQIGYNVVEGALVNRLTRDIIIEPITPNTDIYGFYIEPGGTNYSRALILKDVYLKYCGSSYGQVEGGIYIREGTWKSNSSLLVTLTNTIPALAQQGWFEGVTMTGTNTTRDWGGFWVRGRYDQLRCCHVQGRFNSSYGLYYREGQCLYNSIAVGSDSWGPRLEGCTEYSEIGYVYVSRCFRGGRWQLAYDNGLGLHHYITDSTEYCYHGVNATSYDLYKIKATGTRRGPQSDATALPMNTIYSILNYVTDYDYTTNSQLRFGYHSGHIDRGKNTSWFNSIEHNMEYDAIYQATYLSQRIWDNIEGAWRVYNIADVSDYGSGWFESIFVPSNVTVRAKAQIKLAPNFSGTYPRFEARSTMSGIGPNQMGNSGGQWSSLLSGGYSLVDFTAAAANSYETKEITISPTPFPRYINIGVHVRTADASEGYWMKDIVVLLDKPYSISAFNSVNSGPSHQPLLSVRSTLTETKLRLGGGIF
jgi:hypothetical protein